MKYITDLVAFRKEQEERLVKYYATNKTKLQCFGGAKQFVDWYLHQLDAHGNACHYCNTDILTIRKLINEGKIGGRAVAKGGLRGPNLEIDRKDPFGVYDQHNCVLSCYYCNNDKSNTFSYEVYRNIIGPARGELWEQLDMKLYP